ncbi:factor-independent urate hydroxylase [Pedosphaera parvula]|uniref:Uricase n=1 Tax=Pedosphaera parvula (strain Ellin514) TaxID=320771 RepID=B9XKX5_PEDPL|nr:urate oxidase [Pedosphaera parvula]EEF59469.1 urate oxidase [Pedosphaera parvula Ellin514]
MKLAHQQYGKDRVRVMKVTRNGSEHTVKEVDVSVALEGDFVSSYTSGDNSTVVPTDTMKNTVNALAKQHLGGETERFGIALGEHFLKHYSQIQKVTLHLSERMWKRLSIDGKPHPHAFSGNSEACPFAHVTCNRDKILVESGIKDLLILKSTESGFEGYPKCEYTTLPETKDRIMATSLEASWTFQKSPKLYGEANRKILNEMLAIFANNYSPSVQTTLYQMAEAALKAVPEISRVTLKMPNKHYLLINLKPFGLENNNEVFVPTEEPHGQIEATVTRD